MNFYFFLVKLKEGVGFDHTMDSMYDAAYSDF